MLRFVAQLLLTSQAFGQGQQPGWPNRGVATGLVQQPSSYPLTGQASAYTQPGGYQQQSPAAWSTDYAYNSQHTQPAPFAYNSQPMDYQPAQVQPYLPPPQPLPSREVVEQEKEAFVRESKANLQAELKKLEEEVAKAKDDFVTEQENAKRQYRADMENNQMQHFQDLDRHLVTRKQDATTAANDYAARVEQQAKDLIKNTEVHNLRVEYKRNHDVLTEEEMSCKEELEYQIRAAYDARRYGASFSDPAPAIEAARRRFDEQMQAVAQKRNALQHEFQQKLAA